LTLVPVGAGTNEVADPGKEAVAGVRGKVGSRVKIRSAGTRKCIRRYDRAGGVLGAVDAVAVARKRENVWLSSHRDSKAEQRFLCCARRNLAVPCHS
jgi:hypothetical protein